MNVGKQFELDFKNSIPDNCLLIRIPDPPQSFTKRDDTKFSKKNPCDFYCYDTFRRIFYAFELKSTKNKYISYEDITVDEPVNKMIHKHQIIGLIKYSQYDNVISGFIFNFRDEQNHTERIYFQNIKDFNTMCKKINKSSFNEMDLLLNKAVKIQGQKKRVHYKWDMQEFFNNNK